MIRLSTGILVALSLTGCLSSGAVRVTDILDLEMVRIDGGPFLMGDTFELANEDALPVHNISVETFYLARYETTFDQYDAYARRQDLPLPMPNETWRGSRAVVNVSWDEALAFCNYIGGRLPTEREWEYAAAGGAVKQKYAGTDSEDEIGLYVAYRENSDGMSLPVGVKEPNVFGLYDMSGNVGEWIGTYYEKYPNPGEEPVYNDLEVRDLRLVRGGGISSELSVTRTYWRAGTLRDVRTPSVGFRCAMDVR